MAGTRPCQYYALRTGREYSLYQHIVCAYIAYHDVYPRQLSQFTDVKNRIESVLAQQPAVDAYLTVINGASAPKSGERNASKRVALVLVTSRAEKISSFITTSAPNP
ncbi:MAG: hypothetical protein DDT20_01608 [Firmicutes bacterium]|nr:hypothetical protein [Bacillota bacterium]